MGAFVGNVRKDILFHNTQNTSSMNTKIRRNVLFPIAILAPILILVSSYFVYQYFSSDQYPYFINFIVADIVLTAPLAYFLIIRKTKIPNYTVLSVFAACLFILGIIIPTSELGVLAMGREILIILIELAVISFGLYKVLQLRKALKAEGKKQDFYESFSTISKQLYPKRIAHIIANEVGVIYYTFSFKRRKDYKETEYTYHKTSGMYTILCLVIGIIFIETFAIHFALMHWSHVIAWILTIGSIYTAIQVTGLMRSFSKRPHEIDIENEKLNLRYGFFGEGSIDIHNITKVELTARTPRSYEGFKKFSFLGEMDTHNVILHFDRELTFTQIFGIEAKANYLGIYVDNKQRFKEVIDKVIKTSNQ